MCSGLSVNEVRTELGRVLAREQGVEADVVVPVPDSGVCAAMGSPSSPECR
jgi:amidophosphoribosyltransferase